MFCSFATSASLSTSRRLVSSSSRSFSLAVFSCRFFSPVSSAYCSEQSCYHKQASTVKVTNFMAAERLLHISSTVTNTRFLSLTLDLKGCVTRWVNRWTDNPSLLTLRTGLQVHHHALLKAICHHPVPYGNAQIHPAQWHLPNMCGTNQTPALWQCTSFLLQIYTISQIAIPVAYRMLQVLYTIDSCSIACEQRNVSGVAELPLPVQTYVCDFSLLHNTPVNYVTPTHQSPLAGKADIVLGGVCLFLF